MSKPKTRLPAKLSNSLQGNLTRYAVAAGAAGATLFALGIPSEAEIIHTKVNRVIGRGRTYVIDLNHDGIADFSIYNSSRRCSRTFTYCPTFEIAASPANGNSIVYSAIPSYAAALRPGAVIGSAAPANNAREIMAAELRVSGSFYDFGNWLNASNRFLGLSFELHGQYHYGWARLTVRSPEKYHLTILLSDFAYETEPNTPIQAGATGKDESAANHAREGGQQLNITLGALALGAK
jgi:hypothetical protein